MSVISIVMYEKFVILMGDTKLNNNSERNIVKKVFKKQDILLGFTGDLDDGRKFFAPIFNPDFTLNETFTWGDYDLFVRNIDSRFYDAIKYGKQYDVAFIICGQIGQKFVAKIYSLMEYKMETLISNSQIRYFYMGESSHLEVYDKLMYENAPREYSEIYTVKELLDIFQKTLDFGVQHDQTINNKIDYEYIELQGNYNDVPSKLHHARTIVVDKTDE